MRILLTNDDGIYAEGMLPLVEWAKNHGDVTVVAPLTEQSAKSHSIELRKSFQIKQVDLFEGVTAYAVDSTPADCIRFAKNYLKLDFDLVISGINRGYNMGYDIMYSGTVSAAYEAAAQGYHSLAVSTSPEYYPQATEHLDRVIDFIFKHDLYKDNLIYNVNIPPQAGPIVFTKQGGPYFSDNFRPEGNDFYMPVGKCVHDDKNDNSIDTDAVIHGYISITPLALNRTQETVYQKLVHLNEA